MQKKTKLTLLFVLTVIFVFVSGVTVFADSASIPISNTYVPALPLDFFKFNTPLPPVTSACAKSNFLTTKYNYSDAFRAMFNVNNDGNSTSVWGDITTNNNITVNSDGSTSMLTYFDYNATLGRLCSPYYTNGNHEFTSLDLVYTNCPVLMGKSMPQISFAYINRVIPREIMKCDVDYNIYISSSKTNEGQWVSGEYTTDLAFNYQSPYSYSRLDVKGVMDDIVAMYPEAVTDSVYIGSLSLHIYVDLPDGFGDYTNLAPKNAIAYNQPVMPYHDYVDEYVPLIPTQFENRYVQVVNDRNFSDLLDWLGDVMESVLTTELFVVGNISVTPAILLSTIVGLLLILMVLKFFAGG